MSTASIVREFRDGLARGELLLQHCRSCDGLNMYPRYACPHCQSQELDWRSADGAGHLMSFTILRAGAPRGFEDELPYALGIVRLKEGVQLLGRLMPNKNGEWSDFACDAPVQFISNSSAATKPYPSFASMRSVPLE